MKLLQSLCMKMLLDLISLIFFPEKEKNTW